ncbi:Sec-independent protein translocase protein TatB [Vibrio sp. 10N.261.55.A7]|uniref:Sec-independent protein translocase protein TatB n=1 Tax=Vibrio sp. 10N.261.55.A7 TaxID=1880851 RepID=UPI000C81A5A0|nr:Sec-independent protein translocase protein TatB [Vibrio sp. 10N.261.55.A7]PMK04256.1 twin arginine-targeting protein translocase TatB [Vibrio sp. 10N.261.55.A7]
MFDIGFWELVLISVVGLVVLGPERLPHAIRSVSKFIGAAKGMANSVKDELTHELKIQELQENLKKAEQMGMEDLSPELKSSVEELKQAAQDVQRPFAKESNAINASSSQGEAATVSSADSAEANTDTHEHVATADKKAE